MLAIARYEAAMLLRTRGVWFAYGIVCAVYLCSPSIWRLLTKEFPVRPAQMWQLAGQLVFQFNMFLALVAGIVTSDRLQRDIRLKVSELQRSAPVGRWPYLMGKYLGALAVMLSAYGLWLAAFGTTLVALGVVPAAFLPRLAVAFVAIGTPAFAFVVAISMAGPLVAPLRVYQISFIGYWFWGNYLNPKILPTLNGTLVTASGIYALQAFFGGFLWGGYHGERSPSEAWMNLATLTLCTAGVLALAERYLAWRERKA